MMRLRTNEEAIAMSRRTLRRIRAEEGFREEGLRAMREARANAAFAERRRAVVERKPEPEEDRGAEGVQEDAQETFIQGDLFQ